MTDLSLTVSRIIRAPIEKVYNAWLNPEMLARFMIPGDGMTVPKAETEPKVGGRFHILMAAGDQEIPHGGEYKTLTPYTEIAFTWESPYSIDESIVTIRLEDTEEGILLQLHHVKFPTEESRDNHEGGWTAIVAKLASELA